jgi:hypothetical protein
LRYWWCKIPKRDRLLALLKGEKHGQLGTVFALSLSLSLSLIILIFANSLLFFSTIFRGPEVKHRPIFLSNLYFPRKGGLRA